MGLFELKSYDYKLPKWFGNGSFHASHRANFLRKANEHKAKYDIWLESNSTISNGLKVMRQPNKLILRDIQIYNWYQQFGWIESPDTQYWFPVQYLESIKSRIYG